MRYVLVTTVLQQAPFRNHRRGSFSALLALALATSGIAPLDGVAQETPASTDRLAAVEWGAVASGLQLHIATGPNTETLARTTALLYLSVQVRNVAREPVFVDLAQATYDFEYEIDGTWYAFAQAPPLRTSLSSLSRADREFLERIEPDSVRAAYVTVPLGARQQTLQLHALTGDGLGVRFEATPGPHVIRARPSRVAFDREPRPVSNAVTITLPAPSDTATGEQVVSFLTSAPAELAALRFAAGPSDADALVRQMLARPPTPSRVAALIAAREVEILPPLPVYELRLPRTVNGTTPRTFTTTTAFHYLVRTEGRATASLSVVSGATGSVLNWIGTRENAEARLGALQALALMPGVAGGNYEPRLLRIYGVRGAGELQVVWLHSSAGRPDLFYRPDDPEYRGKTSVQLDRVYTTDELLATAPVLPVSPKYNEAWAIATATACSQRMPAEGRTLIYESPSVEIGLSDAGDRVVWRVHFSERLPPGRPRPSHSGADFLVDEADGACQEVYAN